MYKYLKSAFLLLPVLYSSAVFAAASADPNMDHSAVLRDSSVAITQFPDRVYGNFCQGVIRSWALDPAKLATVKTNSKKATKRNSTKLSTPDKEAYDYVYCLQQLEETGLIKKPFKDWSVEDVQQVNAWMTRLQVDVPGKFRDVDTAWPLRDFSIEEKLRMHKIVNTDAPITEDDREFLKKNNHFFPAASEVPAHIESMLKQVRSALISLQSNTTQQAVHDEINIAGYVHHQIVAIHPWHEANKRTGRVLSYVVEMQYGIKPPTFEDAKKYIEIFFKNLKEADCSPLSAYTRDLIVARQKAESTSC